MLLNKKLYIILLLSLLIISCNKSDNKMDPEIVKDSLQSGRTDTLHNVDLDKQVEKIINAKPSFVIEYKYADSIYLITGAEYTNKVEIGFRVFNLKKTEVISLLFKSRLLKGSFQKSRHQVKTIEGKPMLYYSSLDYFMGVDFGEVFNYLIDPINKEIYYVHLFTSKNQIYEMYISENIKSAEIKRELTAPLLKDYPSARTVKKDVDLDNL